MPILKTVSEKNAKGKESQGGVFRNEIHIIFYK